MRRRTARAGERDGYVLVAVLGALTLLTLLIVSLSGVLRLEQAAAANALEEQRARLVAEAGLERAVFLIGEHELLQPLASVHAPWSYRSQDGARWGHDVPLEDARHPSFEEGVTPHGLAYSGWPSTTYGGELFSLKVIDCSSRLCLNGQQPSLASMLDALGRAVREHDARGVDPIAGRGAEVLRLRALLGGSFTALEQLEPLLGADDLEALRPHVTLDAWRDPVRGLHPVNANTASWPVLVACLEGLGARLGATDYVVDPASARLLADAIDARRLDAVAGPLTGPQDLEAVLRRPAILAALELAEGDLDDWTVLDQLVLASTDPTVVDTSRNPDANHLARGLSRDLLTTTTTPFCYMTYGLFEITSLGRVLDADGGEVARAEVRATVAVYDVHRLSTQEDLEVARSDDDPWAVETFPNPVATLAGPRRWDAPIGAPPPGTYSIADPAERLRVRWRAGDPGTGYLQAAPSGLAAQGVVFRFDSDLQSERGDRPLPGGRHDDLYRTAYDLGVDPYDLGDPTTPRNPLPSNGDIGEELHPDGLSIEWGAKDVRYANVPPPSATWMEGGPTPIVGGSGVITVRFKLGESWGSLTDWTPLFEGRVLADPAHYVGAGPTDYVDVQVEGRLDDVTSSLLLRTRFASSVAPAVASPPDLPPELSLGQRVIEQQLRFGDVQPGEWHVLTVPFHLNAHVPLVDGERGALDPLPTPWAAPAWGPDLRGTIAPGGYAVPRPEFVSGTIDDLMIVRHDDPELGLTGVRRALQERGGVRDDARYTKVAPDLMGSFRGALPPLPSGARLGACVWSEFLPAADDESCFMVQLSTALGPGLARRQVGSAPRRRPLAAGPLASYWWARHLRERRAWLAATLAHTEGLLVLAQDAPSRATFGATVTRLQAALASLEAELGTLAGGPEPASARVDFGPVAATDLAVRLQVDLIHVGDDESTLVLSVTPAVAEIVLLYQVVPRELRRETP